jgi:hypothetical protein
VQLPQKIQFQPNRKNIMTIFRIQWTDPETGEAQDVEKEFHDTPTVTAREWAEDWAYTQADKGPSTITEVKPR